MKKTLLAPLAFSAFFAAFSIEKAVGQDMHFSQAALQPLHQNPALVGIFDGSYRAGATYRSQWRSVPAPFSTISAFADGKILDRGSSAVTAGLRLDSDRQGDAELSWAQATLFGAFSRALGKKTAATVGASVGFGQRNFDISKLRFREQFIDGEFDPAASSGELLDRSTGAILDLGAGVNFHFRPRSTRRTATDLGIGFWHLNRPEVSFRGDAGSRLGVRTNLQFAGLFQVSQKADALVFAHFQPQGAANSGWGTTYLEAVGAIGGRLWLIEDERAVSALLGLRAGDALVPQIRLEWKDWLVGASYDVNFSDWQTATNRRGGFEISVQRKWGKLPPVKVFKACPIF